MKVKFILIMLACSTLSFAQKEDLDSAKADTKITLAGMLAKLPGPKGERYERGMKKGTMEVLIYAPKGIDPQTSHDQDEVYVVMEGSGIFFDGKHRYRFKSGDVLFVPAHTEHKFEQFTKDFVTWVIFYGPIGGEK